MQIRHRVPAVFSLYMVDVFCCALGCVILLWLVNAREARKSADERGRTAKQLNEARRERESLAAAAALTKTELSAALARADGLAAEVSELKNRYAGALAALTKTGKEQQALAWKLADAGLLLGKARSELKQANAMLAQLQREGNAAKAQQGQTEALALRVRELEKERDRYSGEMASAESRAAALAEERGQLEARLGARGKELADARAAVAALEGRAERRFAGLPLTGERVVILLDMSGSMKMRNALLEDPAKWPLVCDTLARLLESLPAVKQYQVILFSDRVRYPLGGEGRWLEFDAKATPKAVAEGLKRVRPEGETNLYAAFAEAFRYRAQGMDTIYLLSDGLPTAGEGPPGAGALREPERSVELGKHVRATLQSRWNRAAVGQPRVRINAVGFYFETPEVGAFLWALAREHDGGFVGLSNP